MKPEERESVVDSRAMHMISRRDLNSVELENVRVARNPTTVITAGGEVQTNEEEPVYVYDLDFFVTGQILEDTPAVPPLGKLCEDHGDSFEWVSGMAEISNATRKTIIDQFFQFDCKYISYIVTAEH